ncbi:antA/AntB antirepressor family protein [Pseudocitrobacter sp. 73]|uniref:antA/AntB antirepressor family protein n=1 Tax=Pseudocitrobacter sp. 73 TaxID=2605731 RepID=UPI0021069AA3|nr:antA/AntB antirepressor family protein [Pseudocitrobacter sp. 73]
MTSQLIPVFNGTISSESALLVNARDLHAFLGVKRDFSTWIKNRITEYGFLIDADYVLVHQSGGINVGRGGDRRSKDYHLTIDTAKELAMVERNEKGREIRRYFIECEKRLTQKTTQPATRPVHRHNAPTFRYIITLTYKDVVTGQEETFRGGANSPGEIIQGTAKRFGIFVSEMITMPVGAYY